MAVYSAISFAGLSIDAFTNVSFNASFHDEFTTQMAAAANLTSDLVVITECVAGSVQVSSVAYFTSSFLEADPAAFEALVTSDCGSIFDSSYGNVSAVAIETRPAVATFSPPPPNPPPPSPPPAPSPPPPTVSLAVTAATVAYYQGSANRTCLHAAPSGMFSLSVWTASGPSSLTWSFTNSTSCDGSACSVSFCGFQLGAYVLHGVLTFTSASASTTLIQHHRHCARGAPSAASVSPTPPPPPPPPSPPPPPPPSLPPHPLCFHPPHAPTTTAATTSPAASSPSNPAASPTPPPTSTVLTTPNSSIPLMPQFQPPPPTSTSAPSAQSSQIPQL
ncbi:hypothetical protein CYMTET_36034 [Cymbomonas tetramitiformis]|uniref:Uncharacterized protein n=1 Tax=Cymbomonas tetramitiformis TaxID=36881 RepID=A0AAE0KMY9_9CHLO|nr:hypothetical protein CYMTET_36034 [Cymbomonas tetramitiformis]